MLNKEKIIKAEVYNNNDQLIISTNSLEFPKDFFSFSSKEFIVLKGTVKNDADKGEKAYAIFYYMNGNRYKYETEIDLATEFQVNIHVGKDYVVLEDRRQSFKTKTDLVAYVQYVTRNDENVEFNPNLPVRVLNINIGGIFMQANYEFQVGDKFCISMIDNKVQAPTEILRIQKIEESQSKGYGCKFEALTPKQEEAISRFIFDCQLAERDRLKKMGY